MTNTELFFNPVSLDVVEACDDALGHKMVSNIGLHTVGCFPDISDTKIVLIGVEEDRNAYNNKGCSFAPDAVRHCFYQLYPHKKMPKVADLGNIKTGKQPSDTYAILSEIIADLISDNIIPVIIGGSQDITYAHYLAYEKLNLVTNIVSIDPRFDIGREDLPLRSNAYINRIILRQPNFLFNYSNIGYQTYLVDPSEIDLMHNLLFDTHRLGLARMDLIECEPIIRNADILSWDMSAIRFSDAPGCKNVSPNGFGGDEACKMAQLAGVSDKLSSFGIYEYNPTCDIANQSGMLIAEILWYFIDGVSLRTHDTPTPKTKNNFYKYIVSLHENAYEIIFYKSKNSGLWWMEIPIDNTEYSKFGRHYIVPCSLKDYEIACSNEIPERWLQTYKKIKT
ncbi:MAG: formimidoylglutamase [Bacteroidales bacterium]|jgi:arginase family enzyme|nr:formimidoylglutamase [Bacteroidales bacterium]